MYYLYDITSYNLHIRILPIDPKYPEHNLIKCIIPILICLLCK